MDFFPLSGLSGLCEFLAFPVSWEIMQATEEHPEGEESCSLNMRDDCLREEERKPNPWRTMHEEKGKVQLL